MASSASVRPPGIPEELLLVMGALILSENCEKKQDSQKPLRLASTPLTRLEVVCSPYHAGSESALAKTHRF